MPPSSGPAIRILIPAILFGIAAHPALGQLDQSERESVETAPLEQTTIFTIDEAPEIDGVFEEIWQDGTLMPDTFRQVNPIEGAPPTEKTEVYLMRDARNLYVGFRCFDSDPSGIQANKMQRDGELDSDDTVTLIIDPFRDRRTGYVFHMSAAGGRTDGRITGGSRADYNWDGIWYGRVTVDDKGWTCEMAIPFQTILASAAARRRS